MKQYSTKLVMLIAIVSMGCACQGEADGNQELPKTDGPLKAGEPSAMANTPAPPPVHLSMDEIRERYAGLSARALEYEFAKEHAQYLVDLSKLVDSRIENGGGASLQMDSKVLPRCPLDGLPDQGVTCFGRSKDGTLKAVWLSGNEIDKEVPNAKVVIWLSSRKESRRPR